MPISWNEIRHNAIKFSRDWTGAKSESAEKQTFWNEFFQVFGVSRRAAASFEEPVKKISGDYGYIDLFWPGVVLVEHKSAGKDLGKAELQAFRYIQDLARERRTSESATRASLTAPGAGALPTKSCTLADLYDPLAMPPALAQAHAELDRAVDLCYRPEKFDTDRQRVEFLFALYEKLTAPLLPAAKAKKDNRNRSAVGAESL